VYFYFEGSATNGSLTSKWWEKYCGWRFRKAGLPREEAKLLWGPVKSQIIEALSEESHELHGEIYEWKMANLKEITALKQQVELYLEHVKDVRKDQIKIF